MICGDYDNASFIPQYNVISKFPQLFPPDDNIEDDYEAVLITDIFHTFAPVLILPLKKKPKFSRDNFPTTIRELEVVQTPTKRQKKRHKKKKPVCDFTDSIKEEDENKDIFIEVISEEDFVASSCCGGDYCHHYAYAHPNYNSYVGFVDNFFNGRVPSIFAQLQRLFEELYSYIKNQPLGLANIRSLVTVYTDMLNSWGVRGLNCINCLLQLLQELIYLEEVFLDESQLRGWNSMDIIDFFYDVDTYLLQTIILRDYESDLAETVYPIENFIYQSLYHCFVECLRGAYVTLINMVGAVFPWQVHADMIATWNVRTRVINLAVLAEGIRENRRYMFMRSDYECNSRAYFYDGSYGGNGGDFAAWRNFVDGYLEGSLADFNPPKWAAEKYQVPKPSRTL